ncbi:MAG: PAS domain S-box protein, partial [Desulfobacteraceae bacterium]|nr:PAS domain S-box protein [Desulfobacteraceae bacterium]
MAQKLVSGKSGENPESLKANEVKFRMLAELTDSMMFLYDVNGNIVDFNASAVYQYGYTKKELFSLNIGDIAPDFMQVLKETDLSKTTDANDVIHIKTNHHRKDGSQFPAEISLTTLKTGDHTLIMALCRDKTREQKNQKRQDILESILKVAPAGIGMVRNRTIFQANDQLCEMTGYRQKELVGENARILYPSDD